MSGCAGPARSAWSGSSAARALGQAVLITPRHPPGPRARARRCVNRDALFGQIAQLQVGEGAEFEALTDYRRAWTGARSTGRQSARHTMLIAKEYRTERNNHIVMALDAGRAMCEPLDGRAADRPGGLGRLADRLSSR